MRQPGIEPGSQRWQRRILTIEPLALIFNKIKELKKKKIKNIFFFFFKLKN